MKDQRFTFLCTIEERLSLERLAAFFKRSKGDTIRLLIRKAVQEIFQSSKPQQADGAGGSRKEEQNGT